MEVNDVIVSATLLANLIVAVIGAYLVLRKTAETHNLVNSRMDEFKKLLAETAVIKVNEGIAAGVSAAGSTVVPGAPSEATITIKGG